MFLTFKAVLFVNGIIDSIIFPSIDIIRILLAKYSFSITAELNKNKIFVLFLK